MSSESGKQAAAILKAELKRRGVTQDDLAARLTAAGEPIKAQSLRQKLHHGAFAADWFLLCLRLIGATDIRLS